MSVKFSDNKLITDQTNPFYSDYTGKLEKIAKGFTGLIKIEASKNPLIISIDAPWGVGKTAFIDMWGQYLVNEELYAIKFDAWRNDYSEYPLLAMISELTIQLSNFNLEKKILDELLNAGSKLCKVFLPAVLKFSASWAAKVFKMDDAARNLSEEISEATGGLIKKTIEDFNKNSVTLSEFKKKLGELAENKKLFIFIDELDRCKPTFAISVLEIVKHIFDVKNVCCVLSTNVSALCKSISKSYGYNGEESKEYLERFIDIPILLPEPEFDKFVQYCLRYIDLNIENQEFHNFFIDTVKFCCRTTKLSLRNIEKYLRDIKLFLACNRAADKDNKIPEIYYSCVAMLIAKKRINFANQYDGLERELSKNKKLKWINDFFISSYSNESLVKMAEKLSSNIDLYQNKNHSIPDETEELLLLTSLEGQIIHSLYGGIHIQKAAYMPNQQPKTSLKKYINHLEKANNFINLLDLTYATGDLVARKDKTLSGESVEVVRT